MSQTGRGALAARSSCRPSAARVATLAAVLARWSATRPVMVLAGAAVLLVLSFISLSRLHVTSSLAIMLGTHSKSAAAMERVATEYQAGDSLLLLVELPEDRVIDEAGRERLVAFATRLQGALSHGPESSHHIASVRFREDTTLQSFVRDVMLPNAAFYLSAETAVELVRRLDPASMRAQFERNEAMAGAPGPAGLSLSANVLRDPLRLFELIPPEHQTGKALPAIDAVKESVNSARPEFSTDQRALLVRVGYTQAGSNYEAAGRFVDQVMQCAAELNSDGLRIEPAGAAAIARDSSRVIRRDSIVSCLISVALLYVLFSVFYRGWAAGLLIGGVAAVGMLAGMGAAALFIPEISPLAAMIAALLAGLGTDYGIHFMSHYARYREQGMLSVDASIQTACQTAVPIVTNCFTSIFGFISLLPSNIRMLSDFAVMGAAGLMGALVAVLLLMPAALAVIDGGAVRKREKGATLDALADAVARCPRACMALSLAITVAAALAAVVQGNPLRFESDLTLMHPRPSRSLNATDEVVRRFAGPGDLIPIEVAASTPEELVAASHDTAAALKSPACVAAGVTGVLGLHTLLPDPRTVADRKLLLDGVDAESVLQSFDNAVDSSPFVPAAFTGFRDFLRAMLTSRHAPTVQDLLEHPEASQRVFRAPWLSAGKPPTSTVLLVKLAAPLRDREQRSAAVGALSHAASTVQTGVVTLAGIAAVSAELEEASWNELPRSVAMSFLLVLAWLAVVFRRTREVLLALVPLVFAASTTVLFIMATGQKFNPINSVALPLLTGIAVDAGVFLVSAYRVHGSTRAKLRLELRSTTHAVLLSVATTVTAFAALCFTHTPAIQSLGLLSAIGIVASGVGALLLLMPVLIILAPEKAAS